MSPGRDRTLRLTGDAIRAYSRRGNYHSDPEAAHAAGLAGLVAQGMQVAGPAYGAVLDAWGDAFLDRGVFEVRFVGLVGEDDEVRAQVTIDGGDAHLEVENTTRGHVAVVGSAQLPPSVVVVSTTVVV